MDMTLRQADAWLHELGRIIERHRQNGITLSISARLSAERVRTAVFANIFLPAERRGWGEGSGAVHEVMDWADRNNVIVRLTPDHHVAGMNRARLERFWRGMGFRPVTDTDRQGAAARDEFTETHIREPAARLRRNPVL